jgi:hypothetical protein
MKLVHLSDAYALYKNTETSLNLVLNTGTGSIFSTQHTYNILLYFLLSTVKCIVGECAGPSSYLESSSWLLESSKSLSCIDV